MNPALAAIAAITIGGAVLAVSARDVRATLLGLLVVLLGAPLVADPWPDPLSILARIAATLLAIRLISIGLRGDLTTSGTRIGWPAEALLAAAAAVVGFGSHGLGAAPLGPAEAQATGFALVALAVAPLFAGRDALRLAVGALLLLVGGTAIRTALDAPASQAEQLVGGLLTIALGGGIAVIVVAARAAGGLAVVDAAAIGPSAARPPDAHRPADRAPRTPASRRAPEPLPATRPSPEPLPATRPSPAPVRPTRPSPAPARPTRASQPGLWGQPPDRPPAGTPDEPPAAAPTDEPPASARDDSPAAPSGPTSEATAAAEPAAEPRPARPARSARTPRRKPDGGPRPKPGDRP